jgi:hypothetical protein
VHFNDVYVNREERFSLGRESQSGKLYLSIPVSNGAVDYEEYYEITEAEFALFQVDRLAARDFAERCRHREADGRLMIKPGKNRGAAV